MGETNSEWLTCEELVTRWNKMPFEILGFMRKGLPAYSHVGRKIINPKNLPIAWQGLRNIELSLKNESVKRLFWEQRKGLPDTPFPAEPYVELDFQLPIDNQKADEILAKVKKFIFKVSDVVDFEKSNDFSSAEQNILSQIATVSETSQDSTIENLDIETIMRKARSDGGKVSKKNAAIIKAVESFLAEKPKLMQQASLTIAQSFQKKHKSTQPMEITIGLVNYIVYSDGKKIISECTTDNRNKYHGKSIAYSTFVAKYVPEAKKST